MPSVVCWDTCESIREITGYQFYKPESCTSRKLRNRGVHSYYSRVCSVIVAEVGSWVRYQIGQFRRYEDKSGTVRQLEVFWVRWSALYSNPVPGRPSSTSRTARGGCLKTRLRREIWLKTCKDVHRGHVTWLVPSHFYPVSPHRDTWKSHFTELNLH